MRSAISSLDLDRFGIGLLLVAVAFAACFSPAQVDTWWQLRAGQAMWQSHRLMLRDEFTYTVFGQPWPNHEWLTQVLFYGTYRLGGMPLLTALCAAAIASAWTFVMLLTRGRGIARVAIVGLAAAASSPGWSLRPQALTLALCALTLWILVRQRFVYALPVIMLMWANLHGAVALGGVLIVAAWCSAAATQQPELRRLTIAGLFSAAATLATPLGLSLWTEIPQSLARLHAYGVDEWLPPDFVHLSDLPLWIAAASTVALAIARRQRLRSFESLTLFLSTALMFVLATRSERNVPPFFVCAAPTIALLADGYGKRRSVAASPRVAYLHLAILAVSIVFAVGGVARAWHQPLPRLGWQPLSDSTVAAVNACRGRLYTRYDEGGYVIWFIPDRKVFVDNRQDPFPQQLVLEHIRAERSGDYQQLFDRYGITCSLNPPASLVAAHLRHDGWREVGGSGQWKVYEKPPA